MTMMTTDYDDFDDILERVKERFEQWGEELYEQGWYGTVGMLIEGESGWSEYISPLIGGNINLERGEDHTPEHYEVEDQYRYGTDDDNFPMNQIRDILDEYTGTDTYWYDIGMRITPEDGVWMSVRG